MLPPRAATAVNAPRTSHLPSKPTSPSLSSSVSLQLPSTAPHNDFSVSSALTGMWNIHSCCCGQVAWPQGSLSKQRGCECVKPGVYVSFEVHCRSVRSLCSQNKDRILRLTACLNKPNISQTYTGTRQKNRMTWQTFCNQAGMMWGLLSRLTRTSLIISVKHLSWINAPL